MLSEMSDIITIQYFNDEALYWDISVNQNVNLLYYDATPNIPDDVHYLIVLYVLYKVYSILNVSQMATSYMQQFVGALLNEKKIERKHREKIKEFWF